MSELLKTQVFATSKDPKKSTVKLESPVFKDTVVWLNLVDESGERDWESQSIIAELLRNTVGSGFHFVLEVDRAEVTLTGGKVAVAITAENLACRWELVANAGKSEERKARESKARELFATDIAKVASLAKVRPAVDNELPF